MLLQLLPLFVTQFELLEDGAEKLVPRSIAPNDESNERSSLTFHTYMLEPATETLRPTARKLLDFSSRANRSGVAFAAPDGAKVADRVMAAVPPAALATVDVIVRPVAATASETKMDERRRTQNSCGWSKVWKTLFEGLKYCKPTVQTMCPIVDFC